MIIAVFKKDAVFMSIMAFSDLCHFIHFQIRQIFWAILKSSRRFTVMVALHLVQQQIRCDVRLSG